MGTPPHIVIFSHGFGVRKDDRGLFTDIASALCGVKSVMFDYNETDEKNNTLTVRPLSRQAEMLNAVISDEKSRAPAAIIDIVCHSRGSTVAAVALPVGIRKVVCITPPMSAGIESTLARYRAIPGALIAMNGVSRLPRKDGSFTLVPAEYWTERLSAVTPTEQFNALSRLTDLTLIKARQDSVLGDVSFAGLADRVRCIALDGDHSFGGEARKPLLDTLKGLLL